ncbi:6876_t:CDS:2 [Ambispora leptoticha]|uniref:6876_t:CDS:1 n=1 Tax=Ambispora leptoticha TaxID=144679 RepID=A0A9N9G557_9GLOM|nr:6876_t:CDS:2 [Ambispora leptoticha]
MSEDSQPFQISDTMSSLFNFDFTETEDIQNWAGIAPTMEDIEAAAAILFSNDYNNDAQTASVSSFPSVSPTQTTNQGTKETQEFAMSAEKNSDLMEMLFTQKFFNEDSSSITSNQGVKESVTAAEDNNFLDILLPQEFLNVASSSDILNQYPETEINGAAEGERLLTDDSLIFPNEDMLYALPFIMDTSTSTSMDTSTSFCDNDFSTSITTPSTTGILDESFLSIFDESTSTMQDNTTLFGTSPASTSSISDLELFLSTFGESTSNISDAAPTTQNYEYYCNFPSTVFPITATSTIPAVTPINYITPASSQTTSPEKKSSLEMMSNTKVISSPPKTPKTRKNKSLTTDQENGQQKIRHKITKRNQIETPQRDALVDSSMIPQNLMNGNLTMEQVLEKDPKPRKKKNKATPHQKHANFINATLPTSNTHATINTPTPKPTPCTTTITKKRRMEENDDLPTKPDYSYAAMIAQAILHSPGKKATLNQIYTWISKNYPYYKREEKSGTGWENSIRHNLSLNKAFQRLPRIEGQSGKGCYWTILPNHEMMIDNNWFKGHNRSTKRQCLSANESITPSITKKTPSTQTIPIEIIDITGDDDNDDYNDGGVNTERKLPEIIEIDDDSNVSQAKTQAESVSTTTTSTSSSSKKNTGKEHFDYDTFENLLLQALKC